MTKINSALGVSLFLFCVSTLISQTAMDVFASCFAVLALIQIYRDSTYRSEVFKPFGWERIAGIMILFFALSLFNGRNLVQDPAWLKILDFRWILLAILMGSYLRLHEPERKHLQLFGGFLIFGSFYALMIPMLGYDPLEPQRAMDVFPDGTIRTGGFHKQAIVFAQLYALWISFFAGIFVYQVPKFEEYKQDPKLYGMILGGVAVGLVAIIFSFTRGVWIAIPLSVLFVLMLRRWTWAVASLVAGALGVGILCLLWPAFESRIFQAIQGGDSERIWIWKANLAMFKDYPWFGVGYSHNVELLPEYLKKIGAPENLIQSHAHNQLLHILVGTGATGLMLFLAFWFLVLKKCYHLMVRLRERPFHAALVMGCFAAYLTFIFGGLFESNYEHSKIRYTLAMITALFIWLQGRENNLSQASRALGKS